MNKIRKGDQVQVIAGRNRGGRGVILQVFPDAGGKPERVLVEGVNLATHYERPNPNANQPGGMVKREAPLHASNVMRIDSSGKPTRKKPDRAERKEKS